MRGMRVSNLQSSEDDAVFPQKGYGFPGRELRLDVVEFVVCLFIPNFGPEGCNVFFYFRFYV